MNAKPGSGGLRGPTQCRELHSEAILLPRVVLFVATFALVAALVGWIALRKRRRQLVTPVRLEEKTSPVKDECAVLGDATGTNSTATRGVLQRRFNRAIGLGFVWTASLVLLFQASNSEFVRSGGSGSLSGRPRLVFSFTTTGDSIDKIQSTLSAVVNQSGDGFDAIYVVVPREFRGNQVVIPDWLVDPKTPTNTSDYYGWKYTLVQSPFDASIQVLILDKDFGPGSKILGTLLVEQDPDTIIVYGDDDREYPPELASRALYYTTKFPHEAVAVLGGWISAEDSFYCGRSLEIGVNRVSFVGGAGGVVVRRRFYGKGFATTAAFAVTELSKACFLGDDYYLSLVLSRNHVHRRVVYDSCWSIKACPPSFSHWGLSGGESTHPGGANVEHYQQCIRELGTENDLSADAEFGQLFMLLFSRAWGGMRLVYNFVSGNPAVAC